MSRKTIQTACILLLFFGAAVVLFFFGIRNEQPIEDTNSMEITLSQKADWNTPSLKEDPESDPVVYVSQSGTKYHETQDCSSLKRSKSVQGILRSSAEQQGKTPCSICYEE